MLVPSLNETNSWASAIIRLDGLNDLSDLSDFNGLIN